MLTASKNKKAAPSIDEGLIARIAANDKSALESLYLATSSAVYGFALSIVCNTHTAEDVMQEVYLKIYSSAASYLPQGKPLAWIFTITRSLSLMKLREKSFGEAVLIPELMTPDSGDSIDRILDRLVLRTALNTLGEEERQIVILHAGAAWKHREIAALLDLPLSTVLSKYRRALSKLKMQIKEETGDE